MKILNYLFILNFKLICVDQVKHCKICATCKHHDGDCLKGVKLDCKHDVPCKPEHDKPCDKM